MRSAACAAAMLAALAAAGATADDGAAPSPYAGAAARPLKALGPEEIEALAQGQGMGLAMAAELNHYPGPRHVLDLADALQLTQSQRTDAAALYAEVKRAATAAGRAIIADEQALDALFASGAAALEAVDGLVAQIAERRGRLRFVHLAAHVEMRALLTPEQIAAYDRLRGYAPDAAHGAHRHEHQP